MSDNSSANSNTNNSATTPCSKYCDPQAAVEAARVADKVCRRMSRTWRILDRKREEAVPCIFRHELVLGKLLGQGGFSNVYEISELDLCGISAVAYDQDGKQRRERPNAGDDRVQYQIRARNFLSKHCKRETTGTARYAVKFLKREVMADSRKFVVGAADLAGEARLLSSLEHPNIVKMRGVCAEGVAGFASGLEGGYFIIMDRLFGTLEERIQTWKEEEGTAKKGMGGKLQRKMNDPSGRKRREVLANRLQVAFDIAGALRYLHSHNIIFRDLKPENVGFDVRGDVKVFDFGLSKEVDRSKVLGDGTYKLSGNTGSLRYMAPEVALSKPYNFTADTYSFGTVLHEMISLQKPYDGFSKRKHADLVVRGDLRPDVPRSWPVPLRILIKRSWSREIRDRPSVESAYRAIRDLITKMRNGDDAGLEHAKRRSTHVLEVPPALGGGVVKGAEMRGSGGLEETRRTPSQIALAA